MMAANYPSDIDILLARPVELSILRFSVGVLR
jgi:hypothetical protein